MQTLDSPESIERMNGVGHLNNDQTSVEQTDQKKDAVYDKFGVSLSATDRSDIKWFDNLMGAYDALLKLGRNDRGVLSGCLVFANNNRNCIFWQKKKSNKSYPMVEAKICQLNHLYEKADPTNDDIYWIEQLEEPSHCSYLERHRDHGTFTKELYDELHVAFSIQNVMSDDEFMEVIF
jgi:hypothetical protein